MEGKNSNLKYLDTNVVLIQGKVVINTKNPSKIFHETCDLVDRSEYALAGVLVTGDGRLCSMDVTESSSLEKFLEGVASVVAIKPAGGIVYRLPNRVAEKIIRTYEESGIQKNDSEIEEILKKANMNLTGGFLIPFC